MKLLQCGLGSAGRAAVRSAFVILVGLALGWPADAYAQTEIPPPPSAEPPPPATPPPPPVYRAAPGYGRGEDRPLFITDWPEDDPPPAGYHWGRRVRKGPIIGGSILFGLTYLPALLTAGAETDHDSGYGWLYIPAVGPFLELSNSSSSFASTVLVLDGLAQSAGLALLIWGITSPSPVLVRNQIDSVRVVPTPMVLGRGGSGFGVVGTF